LAIDFSSLSSDLTFVVGSDMHLVMLSNIQPSISFEVAHTPSPCVSFFSAIGSSLGLLASGGAKMVWMPCKIAWVNFWAWARDGASRSPMKLSMYTSRSLTNFSCVFSFIVGNVPGVSMHRFSRGCGASSAIPSVSSCAISHVVFDAMQKRAGDSHHPIWRLVGTTM